MRLHRGEAAHAPRSDAGRGKEEHGNADRDGQAVGRIDAQDDGYRAEAEADGGEDQHGEPADDGGGEARELLAQLGAEQLEARAPEVEDAGEEIARRFHQAGRHLRASSTPATRPMAAAMPTAAQGCARTWVSSSAPAPLRCSRAARSDASARARTSCTRSPVSPAVARSSSSASAITARRSFMRLSADSMLAPS